MRIRNVAARLLLFLAALSGAFEGRHSWLLAQNQDLTQAEKEGRCEMIRTALMGPDGAGKTSGLRYERDQVEAKAAQLRKDLEAVQRPTISVTEIDKNIDEDLRFLHGSAVSPPPNEESAALARRDLDYWTAQKDQREGGLGLHGTDLKVLRSRDEYPPYLQRALAQEESRLTEISRTIAMENDVADSLNCAAYWKSHPLTREVAATREPPPASAGTTGQGCLHTQPGTPERQACCDRLTDPNARFFCRSARKLNPTDSKIFNQSFGNDFPQAGPNDERIQVVGSFQCEVNPAETGVLDGAIIRFIPTAGGSVVTVILKSNGVGHAVLPVGTYTLQMPRSLGQTPQYGDAKVLWAQVHYLGGSDPGTQSAATSDQGDIPVKFDHLVYAIAGDDYQVAVRVSSLHLCTQ